jgi:hypothetical protein
VVLAARTYSKLFVALASCLAGCSSEDNEPAALISTFTGRLETADAAVGVTVSAEGNVNAYVCGGESTFATHSRWFAGSLSPSTALLDTDGFQLYVWPRQKSASVILTAPDGTEHSTDIDLAEAGSRSALYESAADSACRWGAVVVDDGSPEPGVFGTWCDRTTVGALGELEEIFAQVTPVRPIDWSKAVLPVEATPPAGEQLSDLRRVSADPAIP